MFPVTETMSASAESADEEEWYHGKTAFSSLETEDEKAFSITGNYVPCYRKRSSATPFGLSYGQKNDVLE